MKKENIIAVKSFQFALRIIKITRAIQEEKKEYVLSKQLLKSDTSIGAMVKAAEHAESKKDFIHKMSIGLKEANETDYWVELLHESDYITKEKYTEIKDEIIQIIRPLASIVKSSKMKK